MKYRQKKFNNASVLVVALVVVAVATIGVMAGVSIVGYRGDLAQTEFQAIERRAKFNNSRALATRMLYQEFLSKNTTLDADITVSLADGWGSATIPQMWDNGSGLRNQIDTPALSFNRSVRSHATGVAPLRAFSVDTFVNLNDGISDQPLQFQLKSYNPVLGGNLFSVHPTRETTQEPMRIGQNLHVEGRAVFHPAAYRGFANRNFKADELLIPASNPPNTTFRDTNDNRILPSNYIDYPQTTGENATGDPYDYSLDIVNNQTSQVNSYFFRLTQFANSASVNGVQPATDSLGADSNPPQGNDAALIAAIQDLSIDESSLINQLNSGGILSSNVIIAALNRQVPFNGNNLSAALLPLSPLPDDVVVELAKLDSGLTQDQTFELIRASECSYVSSGDGKLFINLNSDILPNLRIQEVDQLYIFGQPVPASSEEELQPRAIAIQNPSNVKLSNVYLVGATNVRRMALAISQSNVLDGVNNINVDGTPTNNQSNTPSADANNEANLLTNIEFLQTVDPFHTWNMILETEGVSQQWMLGSLDTVFLVGGIRTDHSIRVRDGTLSIRQMTNPEFIESLLSRNAWIEIYR